MIKNTLKLGFDPKLSDNQEIKKVFADKLACTLWLAIKSTHLVDERFNQACIAIARWIRKEKEPLTEGRLYVFLDQWGVIGTNEQKFCTELLPYARGEKTIKYTVKK